MKLLVLSDIHNQWSDFDARAYPPVDAILCAGDITDAGKVGPRFSQSREWVESQAGHAPFYWIPGNHDLGFDGTEYDDIVNAISCLNKTVALGSLSLRGVSCSPCYNAPQLARYWDFMTADKTVEEAAFTFEPVDIVLSHCPPLHSCDRGLGSLALRIYTETHTPKLVVCGHIHEGASVESIGVTTIVNTACGWSVLTV